MADLYLYGEIVDDFLAAIGFGTSSKMLVQAINAVPPEEDITLHVNSPGGYATEGIAMRDALLARGNADVRIEGIAASAATIVAMGAREISITDASRMMIHHASISVFGMTAPELAMMLDGMEQLNESIAAIYADRTGKPQDHYEKVMNPGKFYSAKSALKEGLVDKIVKVKASKPKANMDTERESMLERFKSVMGRDAMEFSTNSLGDSMGMVRSPITQTMIQIRSKELNFGQILGIFGPGSGDFSAFSGQNNGKPQNPANPPLPKNKGAAGDEPDQELVSMEERFASLYAD